MAKKREASDKKSNGTKKSRKIKEGDVKKGSEVENDGVEMEKQVTEVKETVINDEITDEITKEKENYDNITDKNTDGNAVNEKRTIVDDNNEDLNDNQAFEPMNNDDIPQYQQDENDSESGQLEIKMSSISGSPNQTLYVNNLNDKIKKDDIRKSLYYLFSTYGQVLDIIALKTPKMRGQAHVVFSDIPTAAIAMRNLQGFNIFGKNMKISFAKTKSNTVARLDGTYRMPEPTIERETVEEMDTNEDY